MLFDPGNVLVEERDLFVPERLCKAGVARATGGLTLELEHRPPLCDQATTLPVQEADLFDNRLWGRPQAEFILEAPGVLGQERRIESVVFAVVLGTYCLQDGGFLHGTAIAREGQGLQERIIVEAGVLHAYDGRVGRGLVLGEPLDESGEACLVIG